MGPYDYIKRVATIESKFYFRFHKSSEKSIFDLSALKLLGYPKISYGGVKPTRKNVGVAIRKFDAPFTHPGGKSPVEVLQTKDFYWNLAEEYTYQFLRAYIPIRKPESENMYMNYNSSPGWPYSCYFKTKAQVPDYMLNKDIENTDYPAFWKLGPKTERLPMDEIKDDKIRTFMIPSMDHLILSKIFCHNFNKDLNNVPWSATGFNWHAGGFNRLIEKLAKFFRKSDWDVKKWDKRNPLKASCYRIRRRFLDLNEVQEKIFWKMADDEIYPLVILEDGSVYCFEIGQPSGSENTTSDNTLGHICLTMYRCIINHLRLYGEIPSLNTILLNVLMIIYGDDVISGHTKFYDFISDPECLKRDYALFGFEIDPGDPKKYRRQTVLESLRFLGFEVAIKDNQYVPFFPYEKVVNSTVVSLEKQTPYEQLIRFQALLTLLVFNPEYENYRQFIEKYCLYHDIQVPLIPHQQELQNYEMGKD